MLTLSEILPVIVADLTPEGGQNLSASVDEWWPVLHAAVAECGLYDHRATSVAFNSGDHQVIMTLADKADSDMCVSDGWHDPELGPVLLITVRARE